MKQISGFENSLGSIGEVFLPDGEIQQMLYTSKRFTDQLDDMLFDSVTMYLQYFDSHHCMFIVLISRIQLRIRFKMFPVPLLNWMTSLLAYLNLLEIHVKAQQQRKDVNWKGS